GGGAGPAFPGAPYTGWQLGRSFGALINNHSVGAAGILNAAADARNGTDWSDVTLVHDTRWQDSPVAQIGQGAGYPNSSSSKAWEIVRDRGACVDCESHRDADAARDASPPGGAEPWHPAKPQSRCRREHDDRSVLVDEGRVLPAARAGQRPG